MQPLIDALQGVAPKDRASVITATLSEIRTNDQQNFHRILETTECVAPGEKVQDIPGEIGTQRYIHALLTGDRPWLRNGQS